MKRTFNFLAAMQSIAIIALVALIGFTMAACGNNENNITSFNHPDLKPGNPPDSALTAAGLPNGIMDTLLGASSRAVDSNYLGYIIDDDGLWLVWKNKNQTNFNNTKNELAKTLNATFGNNISDDEGVINLSSYSNGNTQHEVMIALYLVDISDTTVSIPKNTMMIAFTS